MGLNAPMTSHKRALEIENNELLYDLPNSAPQRLCIDSFSSDDAQPVFSDRGWKSIWQEVIGQTSGDDEVSQPNSQSTNQEFVEDAYPSISVQDGVADIESWMTAELAQQPSPDRVNSLQRKGSSDIAQREQSTLNICYGMVSSILFIFVLHTKQYVM